MKIGIVSTFSDQGYTDYAEHFVDSLKNNLDKSIEVFLYVDNLSFKSSSNIHILNLEFLKFFRKVPQHRILHRKFYSIRFDNVSSRTNWRL